MLQSSHPRAITGVARPTRSPDPNEPFASVRYLAVKTLSVLSIRGPWA